MCVDVCVRMRAHGGVCVLKNAHEMWTLFGLTLRLWKGTTTTTTTTTTATGGLRNAVHRLPKVLAAFPPGAMHGVAPARALLRRDVEEVGELLLR